MGRSHLAVGAAWSLALVVAAAALGALDYRARDPDSVLYAEMAGRMASSPAGEWLAPRWPPGWYMQGLFREHPAGFFVVPALVAKLGFPPRQAAYATNGLYQALFLCLVPLLAAAFADGGEARPLAWLLQLLPVSFAYRIRANHEPLVLLCLAAALYATERSRRRPLWTLAAALALVAMLLVKGVLAFPGLVVCALWLAVRREDTRARAWVGLAAAGAAMCGAAWIYEHAYRHITGESFLAYYLGHWFTGDQGGAPAEGGAVARKLSNCSWYLARVLWFAFPWSVAAVVAACRRSRWTPGTSFALGATALYVCGFSLFDHKAERYIFPAYFVVGAWGAVAALHGSPRTRSVVERMDRLGRFQPVVVWALAFGLTLAAGRLGLPRIKVWGP